MTDPIAPACPASSDHGVTCRKLLHRTTGGEFVPHAGGHIYATAETWEKISTWHTDAGALLAGQPAESHPPERCPGPGECFTAWLEQHHPTAL